MSAELPPGWAWAHLEELTPADAPIVYGIIQPGQHVDGGVPFVRPIDIQDDQVVITALPRTSREISARYSRSALEPGDVVFSIVGTIGKCLVVPPALTGANITQSSVRLRPTAALSSQFLVYLMRSPAVGAQIARLAFGNAVQRLNVDHVRKLSAPLPPLGEQRRIVAKLDDLRARSRRAREALDEVPALLDRLKQSVLAAAFRGDLTAAWREAHPDVEPASALLERIRAERRRRWEEANPRKKYVEPAPVDASDLPPLPPTWTWARLEEITPATAPIVYGIIQPGPHIPDGVPFIRPADINDGDVSLDELPRTSAEIADDYRRAALEPGDVVFSIVGTIGKWLVVPAELHGANITQSSVRLRPVEPLTPMFYVHVLRAPAVVGQMARLMFGNAVQRLNVAHVRELAVPVMPASEWREAENRIEGTLRTLRANGDRAHASLADLDALDQALLAKAFRGELVPQDPADEPASVLLDRLRASRPA